MEELILEKVQELAPEMINSIVKLVQIDSTESQPAPDAPFGAGAAKALDQALEMAENMRFHTVNMDHYVGYASSGEGTEYICAIGHVDVVPAGKGWNHPPFSGWRENGVIYSRGVLDNKGPILSCLYGLYALKKAGFQPSRQIRIIFGCDEETGFEDLKYYLSKEKPPAMGFTPDCKYPVVYAERGRALVEIETRDLSDLAALLNGYVLNARNNGERFGIACSDPEFGVLEVRNFQVKEDGDGGPSLEFAVSYPAGCSIQWLMERLQENQMGRRVKLISNYQPVKFEKDCFLVDTLRYTYERVTGMDGTPVTTTGGTYAKLMPGIVPFGPSFPGQKGIGHQPNEWMKEEDIITNAKIYALSLYRLAGGK